MEQSILMFLKGCRLFYKGFWLLFLWRFHSFSSGDNSVGRADYGTQATSFNIGTGYDTGVSRTYTTDITQKVNSAPSAIGVGFVKTLDILPNLIKYETKNKFNYMFNNYCYFLYFDKSYRS